MVRVVAVTGCLGFIGSHVVDQLLEGGHYVYAIDAETYAANPGLLDTVKWGRALDAGVLKYVKADIAELAHLPDVDAVLNLAAETHVDNSLMDARSFLHSNILGVHNLLELVRAKRNYEMPRFLQVSTDEVYGDVRTGTTDETAPLAPSSPYAASKAAADLLIQSYARTFGIRYNLIRPSNCYGPRQYPEKLIPKAIRYLRFDKPVPAHAAGSPVRSWLQVDDCARAILTVLERGERNATYNVGGNTLACVNEIVQGVASALGVPARIDTQYERSGVDSRYHVSDMPLRALGWEPQGNLWADLPAIVDHESRQFRW